MFHSAPEAKLSGYRGRERGSRLSYRRYFRLPEGFTGEDDDILLHFGAVDQRARVRLNGRVIAKHEGGYLPFSINIHARAGSRRESALRGCD